MAQKQKRTPKDYYRLLFVAKTNNGLVQLFRYGFVGGFSAVVDAGSLYLFTSKGHVHYLISAALAFVFGTIVNYILSILWIFEKSSNFKAEFTLFTLIGLGGLGLNELIIWIAVSKMHIFYMLAKLISVSIVVFWSFTLRKFLFTYLHRQVPEAIDILADIK